jgi:hypothetical protein
MSEEKKIIKMYLHGSKETNWDIGQENGLEGEALSNFMYALYEVEFEVEVDMKTGDSKILSFKE